MYVSLHVKYRLFLSDFNENLIFQTDFRKIIRHKISWKSVQWEQSRSLRKDGRTDVMKLTVGVRNSAKAPKNPSHSAMLKNLWLFNPHIRTVSPAKPLSFCWLKNEYGELVEWQWQWKSKVLGGKKTVSVPLCSPQISHGLNNPNNSWFQTFAVF